MAVSLREIVTGVNSGAAASVNIGAGTQATDVLLVFGWSDFYSLGTFGPPSGGGWTQVTDGTADLGTDNSKLRAWTKTAAGGSATITLAPIIDEDVALAVLVLDGADTGSPVDDADNATSPGTGSPSLHVAPSVSPATVDAYLVCAAGTSVFNGGAAYTSPGSMTERAEFSTPGSVTTQVVATEQLLASGATGTRTFSYAGSNDQGVAVSVAVRTATTATAASTAAPPSGPAPGRRAPGARPQAWTGVSAADAPPPVTGSLETTEADDTLASSGSHTPPPITGTLAVTEADDTLAAAGTYTPPPITGTIAVTEQDDTLSAAGTFEPAGISGTLAVTEAADTLAAEGTYTPPPVTGTLAVTGADDTLAASGTATPPSFAGTIAVVEASDTLDAAGTVEIEGNAGSVSVTEAADTLAAAGIYTDPPVQPPVAPAATSEATATAAVTATATATAAGTSTATVSEV